MRVRRHFLGKDAQVRIAVAFLDVTEDLIVGAVFTDDIDAILDRTRATDLGGNAVAPGHSPADHAEIYLERTALVGLLAEVQHIRFIRKVDDAERAAIQTGDVLTDRWVLRQQRVGPFRVRLDSGTTAVGDVNALVSRIVAYRGWIHADRDEAHRFGVARPGDVEDGEVVVVRVGDKEDLPVRRQAQAVRRVAGGSGRIQRAVDCLQPLAVRGVNHADAR